MKLPDGVRVCGRSDPFFMLPSEGFVDKVGKAGRADVGGFEALNERGVRGTIVVVVVAIVSFENCKALGGS